MELQRELQRRIHQQRIEQIVRNYHLAGEDSPQFHRRLEQLCHDYPLSLIELALVEALVSGWAAIPLCRGLDFLQQTHQILQDWETYSVQTRITSNQFCHITGLDPVPVFGHQANMLPQQIG